MGAVKLLLVVICLSNDRNLMHWALKEFNLVLYLWRGPIVE